MAEIKKKSNEYSQAGFFMMAAGGMLLLYIYLLICLYPFLIKPGYEVTSYVKYDFLTAVSYGISAGPFRIPTLIPLSLICIIAGTGLNIKRQGKGIKDFIRNLRFSSTDIFVALYALFVIISSIVSPYRDDLILGIPQSYMGLASQFILIFIYYMTSRLLDPEELKGIVYASFVSSALVFLIGILQRFGYDIFNLYDGLENKLFISTIGQHTFFSQYMILFITLSIFMVWISEPGSVMRKVSIFHLVIASCLPCILNADMIFSGMFFALSFLFVLSFESIERMKAFFEISLIILLTFGIMGIVWYFAKPEFRLEPLPKFIMLSPCIWMAVTFFLLIYVFLRRRSGGRAGFDISKYRYIGYIYVGLLGLAVVSLTVYIILNTGKVLPENLQSRAEYLLFDPFWGNGRGAIWHDTVMSFFGELKKSPVTAVFGAGPDQYVHVVDEYVHDWIVIYSDKVALYAHNEWLNAFINYGLFGGIAYLGVFISALIRFVKNREGTPAALGAACLVVAYLAHQFFGYQQYISTPYIFLILGIGEKAVREKIKQGGS